MRREYLRVPLVQRLEYLEAFLNSCSDAKFDEGQAKKAIQRRINFFEVEKAKALGRKRPRMQEGTSTLQECLKLARHLGLIDRSKRLTPDATRPFDAGASRSFLVGRMWQTYPRFRQVILSVRDAEKLDLPFYARGKAFREEAGTLYGFDFDRLTLETIRNLATQLEFVNWYPTEQRRQIIYPVACIAAFTEIACLAGRTVKRESYAQRCLYQTALDLNLLTVQDNCYEAQTPMQRKRHGYLIFQTGFDQVFIRDHNVSPHDFEQTLWQEYLGLSSMRPRFPVLYPDLRNRVCGALLISDRVFDRYVLSFIQEPQRLSIYPSGGVLNYAANLAHLGKFLPPKTSQGNFIIYLKIDRRGAA